MSNTTPSDETQTSTVSGVDATQVSDTVPDAGAASSRKVISKPYKSRTAQQDEPESQRDWYISVAICSAIALVLLFLLDSVFGRIWSIISSLLNVLPFISI
jgi:hypothetical protein